MGQRLSHVVEHIVDRIVAEHLASVSSSSASSFDAETSSATQDQTASSSAITVTLDKLRPGIEDALKNADVGIDDRKYLLENLLTLLAQTPSSPLTKKLESVALDLLYKDLPHPPSTYLALPSLNSTTPLAPKRVPYAYRPADGSNYNILFPTMGMAGTPYARTVPSARAIPPSLLPEAGLVFDTLLRREQFVPHPGGVSSLFFAFADLVIHSIFRTKPGDATINDTSSYLDLSPLYGINEADVASVRRKDGSGKLWNDTFADPRILFMPPSACALLVLLNRNHNYIAERMLRLNENGNLVPLDRIKSAEERQRQDDEIFERSRLVNCAFFMQIILQDYVGAILGLARDAKTWRLPVLEPFRQSDHTVSPRGEGNVVSIEFNMMYRWHATLSEPDTQWITKKFEDMFPGKDLGQLSPRDFGQYAMSVSKPPGDVRTWTFGGLKRSAENGRFDAGALAKILQDATDASASAFKARGIPEAMRVVEIMGIEQARRWGACTMNEFRTFMGLKPYASFNEWNTDPSVAAAAEALYHDVDNLELYVGLQAEEPKHPAPGAGLCPGYTTSRAILADAIALTRGDRFMTTDFTPKNLTAWGFQDCQPNPDDGSYGGMLSKLLFRTLPEFYPAGSAYAHFPFMVPNAMQKAMHENNQDAFGQYTWSRPSEGEAGLVRKMSMNPMRVREGQEKRLAAVTEFVDAHVLHTLEVLLNDCEFEKWTNQLVGITKELLQKKSLNSGKTIYVDVVRDVLNLVPVRWIAEEIGYPAEGTANSSKDRTLEALQRDFSYLARYIYADISAEHAFENQQRAREAAKPLLTFLSAEMSEDDNDDAAPYVGALRLLQSARGFSKEHVLSAMVGNIIGTTALFSRAVAVILDSLLREKADDLSKLLHGAGELDAYVQHMLPNVDNSGFNHGLMNDKFFVAVVPSILKTILLFGNVKRVPGRSGELASFANDEKMASGSRTMHLDRLGRTTPWPTSMMLQYTTA